MYYAAYPANVVGVSANGIIMANAAGTASVVATASTGRNVTSYVTVKVIIIPTDIDVSAANTVLDIGGITSVSALLTPSDVTETAVTWESTDTSVLTVNASGIVTAVAPGSAAIRGTTVNGKTDSVTFTVRRPITITLDADGGTCSQIEISAFSGYAIGGLPTATRQYYNFKGWYTANGITVTADTAFDDDTTLYARWEGLPFILTLDANGGAFGPEYNNATEIDREAKVGTKVGALPLPSRDNYSFLGWYTAQTQENGVEVTADYIQQTTTGLTVYAIWISHPYPMYFDANDGTCDILSKTGAVDKPIGELPVPERPYYTFDGWFTSDGTEVTPFYTQSDATPVTVYAHWTPEQYTMTFDVNGGSCAVTQNSYPVDMDIGELPVPTRDYYIFTGWYIEGDPVIHVTASYQQATTDDVTATARWTPLPYSVTFNANGGSCTECTRTVYVDTAIGDLPVPELPYHHFDGWYTSAAGGTEVNSRYTQSTTDELVLYAHWTPGQYTITFYRVFKDSFQVVYTRLVQVGHEVGTLPTVEEPAGYSFLGWFTSPNGGTELLPNYRQLNDSSFNVYTRWSPKPYKMSFNANGGSCSTSSMIGYVDTAIGELPVPTREYYSFLGWYTASTGGVEVTEDYARLTNTNVTVYAHWEPMPYTMMFNANGANASTPVSAINTFRVDTPIGEGQLPEPTRPYYTFDGWYTEPGEDDGVKVTPTYAHPNTSAITVYAHWIPYTYRLLLDANGGDCNPYSIMASVDTEVELPEPYRDCYLFEGWYSDDNTKYTDEYIQATADSVTLHAHWIAYADSITVPSGTINEDTPFFCRGRILVRGVIECVTGGVYQNGVCVTNGGMEFSYTPSDPTMQIWLDDTPFYTSLDLYSLEPGDYTFRIVAHCANGLEQVIADNPIAIVEYTGATSFKFNKIKYYENQKANTGWNTGGTISSDVNLTKVTGIIKKSNGSTIGSLVSITPNATSYDLNSSAFNNKMLFDSCGNGNYVYIVTATDASGRKMELNMYYTASNAEFSAATRVTQTFNMPTLVGQRVTSDRIYLYYASNMHWDNARTFAQNMGGDLTCITSAEENSVVFGGMPSSYSDKYFLIGGYKSGSNWVWCTGESMSYTNWCSGEPSNSYGIETYLSLHVNEGWNDISCGSGNLVGFIVEIPRS